MFRSCWFSGGLATIALLAVFVALRGVRPWGDASRQRAVGRLAATPAAVPVFTTAPTVEQVQQLAELVALRIHVVDILTVEQAGWLSGYQGIWLVRGDCLWSTDLAQARMENGDSVTSPPMIRVSLPRPEVRWARVDHTRTRTYNLQNKAWLPLFRIPESVRDDAMRQAQELVERAARGGDYRQQAERKTERVLTMFFAGQGQKIKIVWLDSTSAPVAPAGAL